MSYALKIYNGFAGPLLPFRSVHLLWSSCWRSRTPWKTSTRSLSFLDRSVNESETLKASSIILGPLAVMVIRDKPKEVNENGDFAPPVYGTKGWVLVEVIGPSPKRVYRFDIGEFVTDGHSSAALIEDHVGSDFWMDCVAPDLDPGWYVFEGVVGNYIAGIRWWESPNPTDDDVAWDYDFVRAATKAERESLGVQRLEPI